MSLTRYLLSATRTYEYGTVFFYCWNQAQSHSPHTPGSSTNTLSNIGIPLIRRRFRHQVTNLAAPRRVRPWEDGPLRLNEHRSQLRDANAGPPRHPRQATSTDCHWSLDTSNLIHILGNTAGRSMTQSSELKLLVKKKYILFNPFHN